MIFLRNEADITTNDSHPSENPTITFNTIVLSQNYVNEILTSTKVDLKKNNGNQN